MKEHNIKLTSAEIGVLWATYMAESATIPILKYFKQKVEDKSIGEVIQLAYQYSSEHLTQVKEIFIQENYPVPIGFSDEDVHLQAPKLYSDTYMVAFIRNLGKAGLSADGMAFSMSARKDIRDLYYNLIQHAAKTEDAAKEVMLTKGVFIRPPYIAVPKEPTFVEKQSFLRGWLGERRTLTAEEISHLFLNHANNAYGKALLMGFAQTARSEELKSYFIRGIELSRSLINIFHTFFEESSLPTPMTWDTEVTESTEPPFSDKLMLFQSNALSSIGVGNIGGSLALSMRHDLTAKYLKMMKDIGLFAEDGINLMIKNKWFERPPHAMDREQITKGNGS
ncbi:DUF3231 family protein [Radiobacillus deserti]|nr:DUF3231 family protein [Radiobacillus deserti]